MAHPLLEAYFKHEGAEIKTEISKTIYEQMTYGDYRKTILASWGVEKFREIERGLMFYVNGAKFEGDVKVILTWADEYEVHLYHDKEEVEVLRSLLFDELVEVLDTYIET